jgi:hypothetical protein
VRLEEVAGNHAPERPLTVRLRLSSPPAPTSDAVWAGACVWQGALQQAGLLRLFPLLADTVCGVRDTHAGTTAGDYFARINALNQIISLAQQLRRDALSQAPGRVSPNGKFLAHQVAVLHVRKPRLRSHFPAAHRST